jgi:outer membrane receptor for ferric coprogen and ferric-rhodotorulic acid
VHVDLHSKAGFAQQAYASGIEGSSPHRQATVQGIFVLPFHLEIDPDYRFVSALPADSVPSYQTADARIAYHLQSHLDVSASGRNLLQPHHPEITGDNGNQTGIKREVVAGLTWSW